MREYLADIDLFDPEILISLYCAGVYKKVSLKSSCSEAKLMSNRNGVPTIIAIFESSSRGWIDPDETAVLSTREGDIKLNKKGGRAVIFQKDRKIAEIALGMNMRILCFGKSIITIDRTSSVLRIPVIMLPYGFFITFTFADGRRIRFSGTKQPSQQFPERLILQQDRYTLSDISENSRSAILLAALWAIGRLTLPRAG